MGNPAEQAAAEQAAVTDGTPGLEQFDEAEGRAAAEEVTYDVVVSGWTVRGLAEILARSLRAQADLGEASHITIEVRETPR